MYPVLEKIFLAKVCGYITSAALKRTKISKALLKIVIETAPLKRFKKIGKTVNCSSGLKMTLMLTKN
jgi:hypothetical protein